MRSLRAEGYVPDRIKWLYETGEFSDLEFAVQYPDGSGLPAMHVLAHRCIVVSGAET